MMYRNSQKRIYIKGGIYFITTNTKERYPFFDNGLFCEVLNHQIEFCKRKYEIDLYAYKINPDHIHLLFSVGDRFTISDAMFSLKKQTAHSINQILGYVDIVENQFNLELYRFISSSKKRMGLERPVFKFHWQHSFHDHYIRDEKDLYFHIEYIRKQHIRHSLLENKWLFIDERYL